MLNELNQRFAIGGVIEFSKLSPGFIQVNINNTYARASISLYGGQLLYFKPHDQQQSLIWLSDKAVYQHGKAIRGGIPVCWPWFGAYEGEEFATEALPAHGYARISDWTIDSVKMLDDGQTELVMHLPEKNIPTQLQPVSEFFACQLSIRMTIGHELTLELISHNHGSKTIPLTYALHSYFNISDIHGVELRGLEQQTYLDKVNAGQAGLQAAALRFTGETDRVFTDSESTVLLIDEGLDRHVEISKENSRSTIIWNPWQEISAKMTDMPEPGWLSMVCIEAANVDRNRILLKAGETQRMQMVIRVK